MNVFPVVWEMIVKMETGIEVKMAVFWDVMPCSLVDGGS
jgi:hypothetical protein